MIKAIALMLCSMLLWLGSVVDGSAQQSTTQGFVIGLDFGGAIASFENLPRDVAVPVKARNFEQASPAVTAVSVWPSVASG